MDPPAPPLQSGECRRPELQRWRAVNASDSGFARGVRGEADPQIRTQCNLMTLVVRQLRSWHSNKVITGSDSEGMVFHWFLKALGGIPEALVRAWARQNPSNYFAVRVISARPVIIWILILKNLLSGIRICPHGERMTGKGIQRSHEIRIAHSNKLNRYVLLNWMIWFNSLYALLL